MKKIMTLILGVLFAAGVMAEPTKGPYLLVYTSYDGPCPQGLIMTNTNTQISSQGWTVQYCPQTRVEFFQTLNDTIQFMNGTDISFTAGTIIYYEYNGIPSVSGVPRVTAENLIGLYKITEIPVQLVETGK